ncbi:MAG TPA: hypothetical protein VF156_15485 [Agromyces sp.]
MTATVETISAMGGQDDEFQARCPTCKWAGDVRPSRAAALRDKLGHDAEAHSPEALVEAGATPEQAGLPPTVEEVLEQIERNGPRFAPLYAAHFRACLEQEFTREEALVLTSDWARSTLWGGA